MSGSASVSRRRRRGVAANHILRHLAAFSRSGLSVKAYCEKHSLSVWTFYDWRKRYGVVGARNGAPRLDFREVTCALPSGPVCEIGFAGGIRLSVHAAMTPEQLRWIVEGLRTAGAC